MSERALPCVLSIGGLDPGGGAGLLADARAIGMAGAFACGVAALLTVQSTSGLVRSFPISAVRVAAQAREVLRNQDVRAIKTGALGTIQNVRMLATLADAYSKLPLVVDPVISPTRGRGRLLAASATRAICIYLVGRATLVTANIPEAEALLGVRIDSLDDARSAAELLVAMGAKAALVKGGHLEGRESVDVLAIGGEVIDLRAKRLRLRPLHGGGCALASLIAAKLALGLTVEDAVRWAKKAHHKALANPVNVGGEMLVLP